MTPLSPSEFAMPERLAEATFPLGETGLSSVRMIDDTRFPWLLLIPRTPGVEEFHHLPQDRRHQLVDEIAAASAGLEAEFGACRINVADIGNRVDHMHVHVVARREDDASWPRVVWSQPRDVHDGPEAAEPMRQRLLRACAGIPGFAATAAAHVAGQPGGRA